MTRFGVGIKIAEVSTRDVACQCFHDVTVDQKDTTEQLTRTSPQQAVERDSVVHITTIRTGVAETPRDNQYTRVFGTASMNTEPQCTFVSSSLKSALRQRVNAMQRFNRFTNNFDIPSSHVPNTVRQHSITQQELPQLISKSISSRRTTSVALPFSQTSPQVTPQNKFRRLSNNSTSSQVSSITPRSSLPERSPIPQNRDAITTATYLHSNIPRFPQLSTTVPSNPNNIRTLEIRQWLHRKSRDIRNDGSSTSFDLHTMTVSRDKPCGVSNYLITTPRTCEVSAQTRVASSCTTRDVATDTRDSTTDPRDSSTNSRDSSTNSRDNTTYTRDSMKCARGSSTYSRGRRRNTRGSTRNARNNAKNTSVSTTRNLTINSRPVTTRARDITTDTRELKAYTRGIIMNPFHNTRDTTKDACEAARDAKNVDVCCTLIHVTRDVATDTRDLINTCDVSTDTSEIMRNTSDVMRDKSDVMRDTSDLMKDTSDVMRGTSDVMRDTSDVMNDASDVMRDTRDVMRDKSAVKTNVMTRDVITHNVMARHVIRNDVTEYEGDVATGAVDIHLKVTLPTTVHHNPDGMFQEQATHSIDHDNRVVMPSSCTPLETWPLRRTNSAPCLRLAVHGHDISLGKNWAAMLKLRLSRRGSNTETEHKGQDTGSLETELRTESLEVDLETGSLEVDLRTGSSEADLGTASLEADIATGGDVSQGSRKVLVRDKAIRLHSGRRGSSVGAGAKGSSNDSRKVGVRQQTGCPPRPRRRSRSGASTAKDPNSGGLGTNRRKERTRTSQNTETFPSTHTGRRARSGASTSQNTETFPSTRTGLNSRSGASTLQNTETFSSTRTGLNSRSGASTLQNTETFPSTRTGLNSRSGASTSQNTETFPSTRTGRRARFKQRVWNGTSFEVKDVNNIRFDKIQSVKRVNEVHLGNYVNTREMRDSEDQVFNTRETPALRRTSGKIAATKRARISPGQRVSGAGRAAKKRRSSRGNGD